MFRATVGDRFDDSFLIQADGPGACQSRGYSVKSKHTLVPIRECAKATKRGALDISNVSAEASAGTAQEPFRDIDGGRKIVTFATFGDYSTRYDCLSMEREEGILVLTLHAKGAPNKPCLWSATPHEQLSFAFYDIARDRENRCVIITGAGGVFCAEMHPSISGLARFGEGNPTTEMCEKMDQAGHDGRYLLFNHLNIEVPMIAAVDGPALIHAELAVLCDIVLASEQAEFQDAPHFLEGLVPGDGVHVVWPLLLGPNRGRYFLLTGQKLSAREALKLGVVNEVLPREELLPRARELARELCKRPTLAQRYARVAMTQIIKQEMLDGLGYGIALESLGMMGGIGVKND
jgi:enoyl-CoA hydratase/carnithine racemase